MKSVSVLVEPNEEIQRRRRYQALTRTEERVRGERSVKESQDEGEN